MVTIDDYWLTLLLSVILPIVVGFITKQTASGTVKSLTLLFLAAVTGTVTSIQQQGGTFDWKHALLNTIVAFVIAVGMHYGLLKPTHVTGTEGFVQIKTSSFGIGRHEVQDPLPKAA